MYGLFLFPVTETYLQNENGVWYCLSCEFSSTNIGNAKQHVESKHVSAVYNCPYCDKVSPSKKALHMHIKRNHKWRDIDNKHIVFFRCWCCLWWENCQGALDGGRVNLEESGLFGTLQKKATCKSPCRIETFDWLLIPLCPLSHCVFHQRRIEDAWEEKTQRSKFWQYCYNRHVWGHHCQCRGYFERPIK